MFDCPWGCGDEPRSAQGISDGPFHQNAWECPHYASRWLATLEALAGTLERPSSEVDTGPSFSSKNDRSTGSGPR